jgi:hypothetical protein
MKKRLGIIAALIGTLAAVSGAIQMIGTIRVVDILLLFFGGFGAGAGLVKAVSQYRKDKSDTDSIAH